MSLTTVRTGSLQGSAKVIYNSYTIQGSSSAILQQGQSLIAGAANNGDRLTSENGLYIYVIQGDNNFVLYGYDYPGGNIISAWWAFQTVGFPYYFYSAGRITLESNGNLVNYDAGGVNRWQVGADGAGVAPYRLVLRNDHNAVLYDANDTIWWQTYSSSGSSIGPIVANTTLFNAPFLSLPGTSGSYVNLGANSPAHFDTRSSSLFMEAWIFSKAATGGNQQIIAITDASSSDWNCFIGTDNVVHFGYWAPSYTEILTGSISFNTWNHIALSWNPSTQAIYIFLNGTAYGPTYVSTTGVYTPSRELHIGSETTGSYFNGYIQDIRVVQGGAIPTTSFTPVAAPFGRASPTYITGMGITVLSLIAQYMQRIALTKSPNYSSKITLFNSPFVELYTFNTITFTNAGATGMYGPNTQQCISTYYNTNAWVIQTNYFNTVNGIQIWTVPNTTTYNIEVAGARGGNVWDHAGGGGRIMIINNIYLIRNAKLYIVVGQTGGESIYGQYGASISAGGGGATWIYNDVPNGITNLLFVAGGGGGTSWNGEYGDPGQITTSGTAGQGYAPYIGGDAGTNGGGGQGGQGQGSGNNGTNISGGQGGPDFGSGGAGGGGGMGIGILGATFYGGYAGVITQPGGFGGGGSAGGVAEYGGRGGGGGYNGGGGGGRGNRSAGGGGSYGYISWTDGGINNGYGYVTITKNV
jgi:hypothetical protein